MRKKTFMKWATGFVAAAVVLAGTTYFTHSTVMAKEADNVTGTVKVETVKTYKVSNKTKEAKILVPQIKTTKKETKGVTKINKEIKTYTDKLIKDFKKDLKNKQYRGIYVSYKVMTNNNDMLTLRLTTTETLGSSSSFDKFYHLNKQTGEVMELKDLFKKDADYVTTISDLVKKQMRKEMKEGKMYFLDSEEKAFQEYDFKSIKKNQNFYIDKKGNVVICFDKYEVAPGSEGCPQFTITEASLADILK